MKALPLSHGNITAMHILTYGKKHIIQTKVSVKSYRWNLTLPGLSSSSPLWQVIIIEFIIHHSDYLWRWARGWHLSRLMINEVELYLADWWAYLFAYGIGLWILNLLVLLPDSVAIDINTSRTGSVDWYDWWGSMLCTGALSGALLLYSLICLIQFVARW